MGHAYLKQRVAVSRGLRREFRSDIGGCAGAVIHDNLLTERPGESPGGDAADGVGAAPGGHGHQVANGFHGITLRPAVTCKLADQAAERKRHYPRPAHRHTATSFRWCMSRMNRTRFTRGAIHYYLSC